MDSLDNLLAGIPNEAATGEGTPPEGVGSAAPPAGESQPDGNVGEQKDNKGAAEGGEGEGATGGADDAAKVLDQIRQAAQPQEGDSTVIRGLRELLQTKLDTIEPQQQQQQQQGAPELSERDREKLDMVNGLFDFDQNTMQPSTAQFVNKLVNMDSGVATQLMMDLSRVAVQNPEVEGWNLGHEFMRRIGLDPMKYNDLVALSRGEVQPEQFGLTQMPDWVPDEYQEAYKQMNPVLRVDVDTYLRSTDPGQKAAGLQLLQDKNLIIQNQIATQQRTAQDQATFNGDVARTVDEQLTLTYSGLLDSVSQNAAFKDVRVHSDDNVDQMVKSNIINGIAAMGDDNSVVASRAVEAFKKAGVDVDVDKVTGLLKSIKNETEIAVRAEKAARRQGLQTLPVQATEALDRRSRAVGQAIALANKYAAEALNRYSPPSTRQAPENTGDPNLGGGQGGANDKGGQRKVDGVLTLKELDDSVLETAKRIREGTAQTA